MSCKRNDGEFKRVFESEIQARKIEESSTVMN